MIHVVAISHRWLWILKWLPQTKESVLYLVKTGTKTAVRRPFAIQLYTKLQRSADVCGPPYKEAQTRSTAAPDRKYEPESSLWKHPRLCWNVLQYVQWKLVCVVQITVICQMQAAQL